MKEDNIQSWLKKIHQAGLSNLEIWEKMKESGWNEEQINQVLQNQKN